jgi:hypothetical protein
LKATLLNLTLSRIRLVFVVDPLAVLAVVYTLVVPVEVVRGSGTFSSNSNKRFLGSGSIRTINCG